MMPFDLITDAYSLIADFEDELLTEKLYADPDDEFFDNLNDKIARVRDWLKEAETYMDANKPQERS